MITHIKSNMLHFAKRNLNRMPYPVGLLVSKIPFSMRPGLAKVYNQRSSEINTAKALSLAQQREFSFGRVKTAAEWAYRHVPFYADLYLKHGVNPTRFRYFEDLLSLPVVTKQALQAVPLEYRSTYISPRSLENTGGSSGQPLDFYIEANSIPHEWAHIHQIWDKVNYRQRDLKLAFAGRSDIANVLEYDSVRHHFSVNIYAGWEEVAEKLLVLPSYIQPKYLHGYPSAIFDFVRWLDINKHPLISILRANIKGLLLGSEFPAPQPRSEVERLLNCSSVSWYGHTERTILAYEGHNNSSYIPFLSYGFVEAIEDPEGQRLIGTSYYNRSSPLIRYDTGDLVDAELRQGIVQSFRINQGRDGEFVIDKSGNKVFLTGLIFGRHHEIFNHCLHIQIRQEKLGQVSVIIVPKGDLPSSWATLFDSSNVNLDFDFLSVSKPFRTISGKIPLLVKSSNFEASA